MELKCQQLFVNRYTLFFVNSFDSNGSDAVVLIVILPDLGKNKLALSKSCLADVGMKGLPGLKSGISG